MPLSEISNDDMKRAQLPSPRAGWDEIQVFALTFHGYERIGERLSDLANRHREAGTVPTDLDELRGCLFFEQRRWRHVMEDPDKDSLCHMRALIEGIRAALEKMPVKW